MTPPSAGVLPPALAGGRRTAGGGSTPDAGYRNKPFGCVSRVVNHIRGTVSRLRRYYRQPTSSRRRETVEPPVRIELTTYIFQVCCSPTELGRPSNPTSLSGHSSASTTRCDATGREDERLRERRPG